MLRVENVSAGYGRLPVIKGVSISVGEGQFVSIVGPNGAGKTTLFKTISGILTPTSGSMQFEGIDLAAVPAARRPHHGIAHVPVGPVMKDGRVVHISQPQRGGDGGLSHPSLPGHEQQTLVEQAGHGRSVGAGHPARRAGFTPTRTNTESDMGLIYHARRRTGR